nr:TonB-dependent receptor [Luteimonas sp. FCS-9]
MTCSGVALAQSGEAQTGATELDRISVTGTRIQSQSITSASPVTEIGAEAFTYSGATKVEDLVNSYPQLSMSFDNFQNNGSTGYATVSLRGLGPERTLALINGRRLPPGGSESRDVSLVPTSIIKRVDILTGGASAVYGADAVAGVVNFVLDDEFEGVSVDLGYSHFQHDNENHYMRELHDARGFDYPSGSSGSLGRSRNIDVAVGGAFGSGGHAVAWAGWRENDPIMQGAFDYSSCALSADGRSCAGSSASIEPSFTIIHPEVTGSTSAHLNADGSWGRGFAPAYNHGPVNYYQRPDKRFNFGSAVKYEVNEHFVPYIETLFVNRKSEVQIAESATFNTAVDLRCDDPLVGSLCSDLGLPVSSEPMSILVNKRNVEGGPRQNFSETTTYRFAVGSRGALNEAWSYDLSYTYGHNQLSVSTHNDFVTTWVADALLGCPDGSFAGCLPYNVWQPGGVSVEAASVLGGVGVRHINTDSHVVNGFVSGDLGVGLPWANGQTIGLVAGYEWRRETYERRVDTNTALGNFTGVGGPTLPIEGEIKVAELFLEGAVPLVSNVGVLDDLSLDLGFRYSDYDQSGGANTWKAGFTSSFADNRFHLRGGFNRAIREPGIFDLYSESALALWGGSDPCAGVSPRFSAAQCANTGVPDALYGNISANPADQYNQLTGGNLALEPETAETWTVGFSLTPVRGLEVSLDYWKIEIEDTISSIGAVTILEQCGLSGDPFLCDKVNRNPVTGTLWLTDDAYVENLTDNFGERSFSGIDLSAAYSFDLGPGRLLTSINGSYALDREISPLPGVNDAATYDCTGVINPQCRNAAAAPDWRHIANARYVFDRYTVGLRWRHIGGLDYVLANGATGTADAIVARTGGIGSYNYLDLSGSIQVGDYTTFNLGVNNIADKEPPLVGSSLALNANALGGYDQAGRYVFGSVNIRF